ncbi:hypothetical protein RUM43_010114 [Polyplax serrata]|uniref:Uncharacterized protein n=1 Tax=Polyplax serrata TaxID=468196 RepID=A0AAN8NZX5_POLSC
MKFKRSESDERLSVTRPLQIPKSLKGFVKYPDGFEGVEKPNHRDLTRGIILNGERVKSPTDQRISENIALR